MVHQSLAKETILLALFIIWIIEASLERNLKDFAVFISVLPLGRTQGGRWVHALPLKYKLISIAVIGTVETGHLRTR